MAPVNQTSSFQSIFTERLSALPPSSKSKSPSRSNTTSSRKGKGKETDHDDEDFLKEAYRIHNHLTSLENLIISVRKPYLSTVEPPPLSRRNHHQHRSNGIGGKEGEDDVEEWKKWEKVKYLTDRERDEIDLRARMILRRCKDRVGVLELGEQARTKDSKPSSSISSTKTAVLSFLPSLLPSDPSSSAAFQPLITAHRASVIWTLNNYLTRLTSTVGNLQEERFKRKEERMKSLGSNATFEANKLEQSKSKSTTSKERKIPDGMIVDVDDPAFSLNTSLSSDPHLSNGGGVGIVDSDSKIEDQLSSEQIRVFESENNQLLENMSSALSSVLSAESSLIEISNLQNELLINLNTQNEKIDLLYSDAIDSINQVDKANDQLKKAKKTSQESRIFLLIFLVGASLALLFLDWYAA